MNKQTNHSSDNQQFRVVEQQLRAANQQLRASEQQLKAANRQLEASNQQLRAGEKQLREEKEKEQKYLDVAGTMMIVIDLNQKVTLINKKGCEILGYKKEKILGRNWFDNFLPEAVREETRAVFQKLIAGKVKQVEYHENPVLTKRGEERIIAWHNAVLTDEDGNIIDALVSGADITERKRAEEAMQAANQQLKASEQQLRAAEQQLRAANQQLRASEQQLKAANQQLEASNQQLRASGKQLREEKEKEQKYLDVAGTMMIVIDLNQKVALINKKGCEILGYKKEKILGRNWFDNFLPEAVREETRAVFQKLIAGKVKQVEYHENPVLTKRGEERIIAWHNAVLTDEDGNIIDALVSGTDITDRKKAEARVLKKNALLDAINRVFRETLTCETGGEVAKTCLRVAEELTGSKFGFVGEVNERGLFDTTAISNPGWDACRIPRSDAVRVIKDMEIRGIWGSVLKGEQSLMINDPASHPSRVGTPKGHPPLTSFLGVPLKYAGRTIGIIALANKEGGYDPEDQQAVETLSVAFVEALMRKRAEKKLLDYQGQLKSLASQLSLTEERERRHIAAELHDRISQPLVISKLELDALRKSASSGSLTETLGEVCDSLTQTISDIRSLTFDLSSPLLYELGFEAAVASWLLEQIQEKHGIAAEFEDDKQTKPLDDDIRALLFRDVRELLINVIRHAGAKKVKVSIRKVDSRIQVRVEDDGVGFKPAEIASLPGKTGGFGLFNIRERLEQLGGRLKIESEPGRGSRVTITAPLKQNKNDSEERK